MGFFTLLFNFTRDCFGRIYALCAVFVRQGVANIYPEKFPVKRINKKGNPALADRVALFEKQCFAG